MPHSPNEPWVIFFDLDHTLAYQVPASGVDGRSPSPSSPRASWRPEDWVDYMLGVCCNDGAWTSTRIMHASSVGPQEYCALLRPGARHMLKRAATFGEVRLLTSATLPYAEATLKAFGLTTLFAAVHSTQEPTPVGEHKPAWAPESNVLLIDDCGIDSCGVEDKFDWLACAGLRRVYSDDGSPDPACLIQVCRYSGRPWPDSLPFAIQGIGARVRAASRGVHEEVPDV